MSVLNVLVVDDHWIARAAIIGLLPKLDCETKAFEAGTVAEAKKIIEGDDVPGLVILDLNLPDGDPWQTLSDFRQRLPGVPIIVMSVSERRADVLNCLDHGAVGYLPKTSDPEHILTTLNRALAGEVAFPQRLLMAQEGGVAPAMSDDAEFVRVCALVEGFTPRQLEVFEHLADGASNHEIASALGLSVNTIRVHLQSIASKLDIRKRSALSAHASRWRSRRSMSAEKR